VSNPGAVLLRQQKLGPRQRFFLFLLANLATAKHINEMGNILPFIPLFKLKKAQKSSVL
jgi:hypothetical protein